MRKTLQLQTCRGFRPRWRSIVITGLYAIPSSDQISHRPCRTALRSEQPCPGQRAGQSSSTRAQRVLAEAFHRERTRVHREHRGARCSGRRAPLRTAARSPPAMRGARGPAAVSSAP